MAAPTIAKPVSLAAASPTDSTGDRRPSLCMKPSPMPTSPPVHSPGTTSSLMSKEWVVPPRPKPGRKPATDTPPTKRKAQNRAAQRAFRERRAARVGELEEQMKQMEEEDEREQNKLHADIERLEREVEHYRDELARSIERCRGLERDLELARNAHHPPTTKDDSVPLPRRTTLYNKTVPLRHLDTAVGCGNCSPETNCQCLDEAFDVLNAAADQMHEKRPHSPGEPAGDKRIKREPSEGQEIDFTALYASQSQRNTTHEVAPAHLAQTDPCGFCSDGTPCVCAQMAAEENEHQAVQTLPLATNSNIAPTRLQLSQFTPPPSEGDVSSLQLPSANPCATGPGTCAQCRADPNSTIFCQSLAASRSQPRTTSASQGCCGGKGADGSCCLSQTASSRATRSKSALSANAEGAQTGIKSSQITLTCADAYTTLSRHPAYGRATDEISSWMPKLRVSNVSGNETALEGRPAMEIDAANVMAVLKGFDRRFGVN